MVCITIQHVSHTFRSAGSVRKRIFVRANPIFSKAFKARMILPFKDSTGSTRAQTSVSLGTVQLNSEILMLIALGNTPFNSQTNYGFMVAFNVRQSTDT